MLLKDIDLVPLYSVQVVIQCQQNLRVDRGSDTGKEGPSALPPPLPSCQAHPTYQEGPKHGNGGQEVPDVMVIKEVQKDAVAVVFPGLCGGFLAEGQGQEPTDSGEAKSTPTSNPLHGTPCSDSCLPLSLHC